MKIFLGFVILSVLSNGIHVEGSVEIDAMLKRLNKPAVKTIYSEDGDIIDCVDIYKQPAFDHPLLKNHKIQMKPSVMLASDEEPENRKPSSSKMTVSQTWREAGDCPEGTVPILRVTREDITRASNASWFGRKAPYMASKNPDNFRLLADGTRTPRPKDRSEAFVVTVGSNYIASKSDMSVWNPSVEASDFTTSQIWMQNGPGDDFDSVEAGWAVNPDLFRDSRTRLFGYWTSDGYKTTGCFNLLCSGFVQIGKAFALGAPIKDVSVGDKQFQITVRLGKDSIGNNWWLKVGDERVGYWPGSLFTYLTHSATLVQWGGQVYSPNVRKTPHTKTQMGSGADWSRFWDTAAFHTNFRVQNTTHLFMKYPEDLTEFADEYDCYSTKLYREDPDAGFYFYFGGSGQNPRCP
ncbi:PREDICTED: uncharacterized protein LOC104811255 [Tarenaya hassleriana]|uniref:uncharacterized protein LOC104811255 n=1 Tax=Tarenaya hassleriana TaxID=28532 RepID=UPI00053C248E|nr:PREDICTED: uncharacterized protein LOC104811255 [Tarenaya hassleriana]